MKQVRELVSTCFCASSHSVPPLVLLNRCQRSVRSAAFCGETCLGFVRCLSVPVFLLPLRFLPAPGQGLLQCAWRSAPTTVSRPSKTSSIPFDSLMVFPLALGPSTPKPSPPWPASRATCAPPSTSPPHEPRNGLRPPSAPHRAVGNSTILSGDLDALTAPTATAAQVRTREPPARPRRRHRATTAHQPALVDTEPGLEHVRSRVTTRGRAPRRLWVAENCPNRRCAFTVDKKQLRPRMVSYCDGYTHDR